MIAIGFHSGVDFDLLETHYIFDNETSEHKVKIIAFDDLILEAEEYFLLYFPTLNTRKDVLLMTETSPNSVRVVIQDDEGNYWVKIQQYLTVKSVSRRLNRLIFVSA